MYSTKIKRGRAHGASANEEVSSEVSLSSRGFTLPELLIAVAIFAMVSTIVTTLYIQAFRTNRVVTEQNKIYEDARFILNKIADEVRAGMIDYDEYYNQHVVAPSVTAPPESPPFRLAGIYGQNYGRYYSSFYNPGVDQALGFDCNDVQPPARAEQRYEPALDAVRNQRRNRKDCAPLRRTIDRNTGSNPFTGKYATTGDRQNAFCGTVSYRTQPNQAPPANRGLCENNGTPIAVGARNITELYLISAKGDRKTILARERINPIGPAPIYALSMLRMKGLDTNNDGVSDSFECADGFQCVNSVDCGVPSTLPGSPAAELSHTEGSCHNPVDNTPAERAKLLRGFVPISPLNVNITDLRFIITPSENPYYAFGEDLERQQPRVTIILKVGQNAEQVRAGEALQEITLVETISTRILTPIPAPVITQPRS